MVDTLDFATDIFAQRTSLTQPNPVSALSTLNQAHLSAIISYQYLTDSWDEDGAIAPNRQTVLSALDIALLLTVTGQMIYQTAPGPVGEIMINLRSGDKSAELLMYPNGHGKFVWIAPDEIPRQGVLTSNSLQKTLQWINPQSID